MGTDTKIEWTGSTWTPIRARYWEIQADGSGKERIGWHCEHASEGCRFCYAETLNRRLGTGRDFKPAELYREEHKGYRNGEVKLFLDENMLTLPLRWKKGRKVFVCSMTDLFADFVPDEWIDRMFAVMALAPQHTFQVLTKRAQRMREYLADWQRPDRSERIRSASGHINWFIDSPGDLPHMGHLWEGKRWPLENVWFGVSCERQEEADERIPALLETPAAVRFLSCEPLLGPIDLTRISYGGNMRDVSDCLGWVIVGGESGPKARPMHPDWARSIRDQCQAAGVPFFFKQWGEWLPGQNEVYPDWGGRRVAHHQDGTWGPWEGKITLNNYVTWTAQGEMRRGDQRNYPHAEVAAWAQRVGKKRAGALLDGREHRELPA